MSKVLLIDDSRVMRRMLRNAVSSSGFGEFTFLEAADGKKALELLEQENFAVDLIFCDLCMPEMGGLDFLDALAARQADCPVIVLTGDSREGKAQEALARGARSLIPKPFRAETLLRVLEEVLHPTT